MTSTRDNLVGPAIQEAIEAMTAVWAYYEYPAAGGWKRLMAARDRLIAAQDYLASPTFPRSGAGPGVVSVSPPVPPPTPAPIINTSGLFILVNFLWRSAIA